PYGPVNQFLNTLLHTQIQADWTANKDLALPGLILVNIWKNLGYFMVIYLAGLQAIPLTVYEAARIDGAGAWAQFRYMTLPLLKPTTAFVMIVSIINAFNAFATIFVMTKGGPGDSTRVLSLLLYETAFDFLKMGRAAAISVVIFAIILVLTLLQLKLTKANHTS
ncbi:MAG: sugar ABC transporter permease, partial [Firmicutes bacterium]|nr:sugar ABC transporter permease [Bacillota bacterium]